MDVDENVHTPVFMKDVEEARVVESAPPNTLVGTFSAVDGDSNPSDAFVSYSLVGPEGRGVFYIDQTGECDPRPVVWVVDQAVGERSTGMHKRCTWSC